MSLKDVFEQNRKTLDGPSKDKIKPKDYDARVADLENPEEIVETVLARLRIAAEFRQPFEDKWRRALMAWMQVLDTEMEDSWESKRYMPMILKQVETALPSITSTVFNGKDLWDFRGMTPSGRDCADALSKLIHWQARGPSRMETEFDKGAWFSVLFGTAFFDTYWSNIEDTRLVPVVKTEKDPASLGDRPLADDDGEPIKVKILEEQKVTVEDFPRVKALNPLDVWAAPYSEAGDNGDWYVMLRDTTCNRLKEAAGHGHIDKDAVLAFEEDFFGDSTQGSDAYSDELFESANANLWNEWLAEAGMAEREEGASDDWHNGDKIVKVLVYRSKHETITIAPGKRIIGYSLNPYMHKKTGIINHQYIPIPGCPYGRGPGTILLDHQELANENINLFMDVAKISLMAPVIVNRSNVSTLDRNFTWTPNKIVQARDIQNAAQRMDVPAPTNLAMTFAQSLDNSADEVTGYTEQARGQTPSGVNTATEFSGLQQNIATRAFMNVRRLRQTMSLIGKMLVSLNQQFMTREQIVSIVGEDGLFYKTVQPWEVVGEVDVVATASVERGNPQMRAQQMLQATAVIQQLLQQKQDPFVGKWIRELLNAIGIEGADTMIPKNWGQNRDAEVEGIALRQGVIIEAYPDDNHGEHIQLHSQASQLAAAEDADESVIAAFQEHIQQHVMLASQAAMAQQGSAPGAEGGSPGRQEAQALGAAQGSNGIPGQSSPGPGAPVGRPM